MNNYINSLKLLLKRLLLLVLVYQISRVIFYIFNKSSFETVGVKEFIAGIRFDLSAIIYINLLLILGHIILGNFKYKKGYQTILKYLFFIINIIFIATNFIDTEYYRFTSRRSSYSLITAKGMEHEMKKLAILYLKENWKLTLSFLLVAVAFFKSIPNGNFVNITKENPKTYLKQFGIFILVVGVSLVVARGGLQRKVLNRVDAVKYTTTVNAPLVLNTPFCILKTINKDDALKQYHYFSEEELKNIYNPIKTPKDTLAFDKKNIVYIILESFGNEHVGYMNNGKGFTPFLDSLITKSTFYKHAFANGKVSIDAMPSMISSIPRLMDKAFIQSSYAFNKTEGMPKLLKKYGYHTAFFHGAFNGSQNFDRYANIVGFDEYYGKNEYPYPNGDDGYWGIFDEPFLHFFAEKMTEFKEPFFTTVFTLSSHNPYTIPKKYIGKFPKGNDKIAESIGYADYSLKKFFEFAKTQTWYNNTIFVLTADHTSSEGKNWYKTEIGKFSIPIIIFEPDNPNAVAISYLNSVYHFVTERNFILFDGEKVLAVYDWNTDPMLTNNLKNKIDFSKDLGLLKAVLQTYNNSMNTDSLTVNKKNK